jgi:hypothetical protein
MRLLQKEAKNMPPPNNPATGRVALTVDRDTRKYINTLHLARTDNATITAADLLNMANVVADWWQNSYRHAVKLQIVGEQVVATKQDPSDPLQTTVYINGPGDYASGGIQPGDVTAAVSWRTGLAGRKYRGRFYDFGVPSDASNTNDTMTGVYLALLTSVGQYLLNHLATAGLKAIVFHRSDNSYTSITSLIVDQLIDSMRNRLAGRGI